MLARNVLILALLSSPVWAQTPTGTPVDHYSSGLAAMEAHDPARAITQFEQVATKEGRAWLAVALMMESRSPADRYVERAYEAAARSRADQPDRVRPRAEIASALRPNEIVVAFLVREDAAYAWAFDRDTLVGYPLPKASDLSIGVDRITAYAGQDDRAGIQRIAEDLVPSLLGPMVDRLPTLTRVIFVMDGPLKKLPTSELLPEGITVSNVDDNALLDEVIRIPSKPATTWTSLSAMIVIGGIAVGLLLIVAALALKRRPSVS